MIVETIADEINEMINVNFEDAKHLSFNENLLTDDFAEKLNNYLNSSTICNNSIGYNSETKFIILNYNQRYVYIHIHYDVTPSDEIMVSLMVFNSFNEAYDQLECIDAGALVYDYTEYLDYTDYW